MFLLRVIIPDRPGSLGAVASALGHAEADINAVEIVEKGHGFVIDDFMLTLPAEARPDTLVSACAALPDVEVMWVSVYPDDWGLSGDIDVLEQMVTVPEHAEKVLADLAPATFHCSWALIIDRDSGQVVHRSKLAPEENLDLGRFGDLGGAHVADLDAGWHDGWGEHAVAAAPFRDDHTIIIGRPGPPFRTSELARLKHLALLAGDHEHV
ncbi:MAG: amino acid-binding protein [Propioniciclava sp.]|uniref:amino acid-binding protein n=1 Tax=Propioniciclava sp. TaxID=2038686 RepID=UPI0039E3788B